MCIQNTSAHLHMHHAPPLPTQGAHSLHFTPSSVTWCPLAHIPPTPMTLLPCAWTPTPHFQLTKGASVPSGLLPEQCPLSSAQIPESGEPREQASMPAEGRGRGVLPPLKSSKREKGRKEVTRETGMCRQQQLRERRWGGGSFWPPLPRPHQASISAAGQAGQREHQAGTVGAAVGAVMTGLPAGA